MKSGLVFAVILLAGLGAVAWWFMGSVPPLPIVPPPAPNNVNTSPPEDHRAFTVADSWFAPPPSRDGYTQLDKDRFAPVILELQSEAQAALADVSVQRINAAEATRLAGKPLPTGAEYVLLRAVVLYEGTGAYGVSVSGSLVHVHHGCLGRRATTMTRRSLVAMLPAVPETVYVSCSMAE